MCVYLLQKQVVNVGVHFWIDHHFSGFWYKLIGTNAFITSRSLYLHQTC